MTKTELSERQEMKKQSSRKMMVVKRDDFIQKSRLELTKQEERIVLFAISQIKPEDTVFTEYTFDLKDFYVACGLKSQSYTDLKKIISNLDNKTWWQEIDDKGTLTHMRWFNVVRIQPNSGLITVRFHDDMQPFLFGLKKQMAFATGYNVLYTIPMKSSYSPRLYELLKSYQKNNQNWFFDLEKLKYLLNAEKYKTWNDFRKTVLEPALKEVNTYTDLTVAYSEEREGRKVARVSFYMAKKSPSAILDTKYECSKSLDGEKTLEDISAEEIENDVRLKFLRENP